MYIVFILLYIFLLKVQCDQCPLEVKGAHRLDPFVRLHHHKIVERLIGRDASVREQGNQIIVFFPFFFFFFLIHDHIKLHVYLLVILKLSCALILTTELLKEKDKIA